MEEEKKTVCPDGLPDCAGCTCTLKEKQDDDNDETAEIR